MKSVLSALFVLTLLTACGQKGALYLPSPSPVQDSSTPAADDGQW